MSRGDGFAIADVDSGLLDDEKVRKLWRQLGDVGKMTHALTLHEATLLASWRNGCRQTVDQAAPVWLPIDAELVAALVTVRLLDRTGRIPARSWSGWFEVAKGRREALHERWKRANEKRSKRAAQSPRGNSADTATDRSDRTGPTGPSGPVRTSPTEPSLSPSRGRARGEAGSKDPVTTEEAYAAWAHAGSVLKAVKQ